MIIVVGAGIAGLSVAHELQGRGAQVTIVEAGKIAAGASGVATSYLEPRLGNTAMRAIERESMRRWEDYAAKLESLSAINVGFRREGQIKVSLTENLHRLEKDLLARTAQDEPFTRLSTNDALKLEPSLSPDIAAAAFLPDVRWVTGRKVCEALAIAITRAGGKIIENHAVRSIAESLDGLTLQADNGVTLKATKVVMCTGIGTPAIKGVPEDMPKSRPVRGVNLVLDQSLLPTPVSHLIKHHRGNLCPREGSQLIVGTTYEAGEASLEPGPDLVEFLYQNAEPILPLVRRLPLLKVTAGLRSKVGDGNLRLGRSSTNPHLYYSVSHGGAGFLRAPVIADELAGFVLDGQPGPLTRKHTRI